MRVSTQCVHIKIYITFAGLPGYIPFYKRIPRNNEVGNKTKKKSPLESVQAATGLYTRHGSLYDPPSECLLSD